MPRYRVIRRFITQESKYVKAKDEREAKRKATEPSLMPNQWRTDWREEDVAHQVTIQEEPA